MTICALQAIKSGSPTSLKLTFEQLERGRNLDLAECFNMVSNFALIARDAFINFLTGISSRHALHAE